MSQSNPLPTFKELTEIAEEAGVPERSYNDKFKLIDTAGKITGRHFGLSWIKGHVTPFEMTEDEYQQHLMVMTKLQQMIQKTIDEQIETWNTADVLRSMAIGREAFGTRLTDGNVGC